MKVMVIVGTRPELIRLSRILAKLRASLDCVLVHTGQNFSYELGDIFYEDLGIAPPEHYLGAVGGSLAETLGNIIIKADRILELEKPDALLVLGDTNSALSVIPAKRRKIPIFHFEAGNRCFDQRVPEEINRKIVDHTSDINLAYSAIAKENLLREGFPMDRVFNIGSPMLEVLTAYRDKIRASDAVERLGLRDREYFLLSSHREENIDNPEMLKKLVSAIKAVLGAYPFPILFSVHPRTEKKLLDANIDLGDRVIRSKPLGFTDYVSLQEKAFCVLSDSGTVTEESSILGFPAINLRETHERQEGMEKAAVIMAGFDADTILAAVKIATAGGRGAPLDPVGDYNQANVAEKVLRIILSYTSYVNKKVWFKN
jgi:UDP-N-acetylglucosamine 2-epimerase (non-hydrolysing)